MIGNHIIKLRETDSTNRFVLELEGKEKIAEGTVITAFHQHSGRGTGDNKWESEKGKNLTVSIVLYPSFLHLKNQFMINKIASLGVYDMLKQVSGCNDIFKIKWTNDIYAGNKKISGMLIENSILGNTLHRTVIGIGININQEFFVSDAPNPVSLKNITGREFDLDECLSVLCSCLDLRYSQLKNSEYETPDSDYLSALFRLNETAQYICEGEKFTAIIRGLTNSGELILETVSGKKTEYGFKEVEFVI